MLSSTSLAAFSSNVAAPRSAPGHPGTHAATRPVQQARSSGALQDAAPLQAKSAAPTGSGGAAPTSRTLPRGSLVDLAV